MTTNDIIDILKKRYSSSEYCYFVELKRSTGYNTRKDKTIQQRLDFYVLNLYPSKKFESIAFEIKVSKADFQNEIKKPKKSNMPLEISNRFYFIAPKGIIPIELVRTEAGLMEVDEKGKIKIIKEAPYREIKSAPWNFVASIGRRINAIEHLDIKNLSDDILHRMITAFYQGNQEKLSIDEFNYYIKLSNELIRRSNIKYNKENSDYKAYQKFLFSVKRIYPYITDNVLKNLWKEIKENKFRTKKIRLEYINKALSEEQKKSFKGK